MNCTLATGTRVVICAPACSCWSNALQLVSLKINSAAQNRIAFLQNYLYLSSNGLTVVEAYPTLIVVL